VSKKQKSDDENLYILIAPTWAGFNEDAQFSTLHYLPELISSIISLKKNNIRFIFRPHPYSLDNDTENKKTIAAIKKILSNHSPENIALSKNSIYEDFNTSDLLITDISSVPIDYLASGKPIIHLDIHNLKERALNDSRFKKYIPCTYLIEKDLSNIDDIITEIMLEDSLSSLRNDVCKYYLGYPPLKSIDVFTTQIRKYVEKEKPINSYSESQPSPHMS
jgi:CDP-glycerol glycerophosphotransferase (TagB/SpsB family)